LIYCQSAQEANASTALATVTDIYVCGNYVMHSKDLFT